MGKIGVYQHYKTFDAYQALVEKLSLKFTELWCHTWEFHPLLKFHKFHVICITRNGCAKFTKFSLKSVKATMFNVEVWESKHCLQFVCSVNVSQKKRENKNEFSIYSRCFDIKKSIFMLPFTTLATQCVNEHKHFIQRRFCLRAFKILHIHKNKQTLAKLLIKIIKWYWITLNNNIPMQWAMNS